MLARVILRKYTTIQIVSIMEAPKAVQYVQSLPSFIATDRSAALEPQYAYSAPGTIIPEDPSK